MARVKRVDRITEEANWYAVSLLYLQLRVILLPKRETQEVIDGRSHSDLLHEAIEWVCAHDRIPLDYTIRRYTIAAVRRKYNALIKGAKIRDRHNANDLPAKETQARED